MNMNFFDYNIISYINRFSQHSVWFDRMTVGMAMNGLFKGAVLTTIFWWVWFKDHKKNSNNREHIISTILTALVALAVARTLALALPFRLRPCDHSLSFLSPHGVPLGTLKGWSSFPSDHAILFFTLATGLFFVSRKVGVFALGYTAIFICFPRLYCGFHYPTDIIAGALIGISFGLLGNLHRVGSRISQSILLWERSNPSLFYSLFFLMTYQIADMFQCSRHLLQGLISFLLVP